MKRFENTSDEKDVSEDLSSTAQSHARSGDYFVTTSDAVVEDAHEVVGPADESAADAAEAEAYESDYVEEEQTPTGPGFWPPSREQVWTALAFGAVFLLAILLRYVGLGEKPLHHDESLHAYFSMQVLRNNIQNWATCLQAAPGVCYAYDPLTHGPFQFHITAFIYGISQLLQVSEHGINTTTARIAAATLGSLLVFLPYFMRDYLGKVGAFLACFLIAISPGLVYYSRFTREDIYMACFTLLMVVAVARYVRERKAGWLILSAVAFILSYATKEATYLTMAVFGSFLLALVIWEATKGSTSRNVDALPLSQLSGPKDWFVRFRSYISVLAFFVVLGLLARWFFGWVKSTSVWLLASAANKQSADALVANLKAYTQFALPILGILLAVLVVYIMYREHQRGPATERRGLAQRVDPKRQPLLDTLVTMPWTHWFFALVIGWFIYLILYTALFTNMRSGIGDGIWQGLYYWLEQQHVARGGQPIYYYLLLIPLYEQIGVVFGLAGLVYCLVRPTVFRLFLVYWFAGNMFIYSWAGEKMPWLMIHITLPLMLLAAVALEPAVSRIIAWVRSLFARGSVPVEASGEDSEQVTPVPVAPRKKNGVALAGAFATVLLAVVTLLPTLQNMYQVSFVHPADAPHEMMIYVQTSTDINIVMKKIEEVGEKKYGNRYAVPIGVTDGATWPFAWYLRDYKNVCFQYPRGCADSANSYPVVVAAIDELAAVQTTHQQNFQAHQYKMRVQWDQGYMPKACVKTATEACTEPQPYVGVGPWLWLSDGPNPPAGAQFNLGRAATNVWNWWWQRKAFGSVDGSYDMTLFLSNDAVSATGVKP